MEFDDTDLSDNANSDCLDEISSVEVEFQDGGVQDQDQKGHNNTKRKSQLKRKSSGSKIQKKNRGPRKRAKLVSTKDRHLGWINKYSSQRYGIWIQCCKCNKWRHVQEYEEAYQVPEVWYCAMNKDEKMKSCNIPERNSGIEFSFAKYVPGSIVWAKMPSYPWWPAMIEDDPDIEEYYKEDETGEIVEYHVTFLDDDVTRTWVDCSKIRLFQNEKDIQKSTGKKYPKLQKAKNRAIEALSMTLPERLKIFSFAFKYKGEWGIVDSETEDISDLKNETQKLLKEVDDLNVDWGNRHATDSDELGTHEFESYLQKIQNDEKSVPSNEMQNSENDELRSVSKTGSGKGNIMKKCEKQDEKGKQKNVKKKIKKEQSFKVNGDETLHLKKASFETKVESKIVNSKKVHRKEAAEVKQIAEQKIKQDKGSNRQKAKVIYKEKHPDDNTLSYSRPSEICHQSHDGDREIGWKELQLVKHQKPIKSISASDEVALKDGGTETLHNLEKVTEASKELAGSSIEEMKDAMAGHERLVPSFPKGKPKKGFQPPIISTKEPSFITSSNADGIPPKLTAPNELGEYIKNEVLPSDSDVSDLFDFDSDSE